LEFWAWGLKDFVLEVFRVWESERLIPDRLGGIGRFGARNTGNRTHETSYKVHHQVGKTRYARTQVCPVMCIHSN